MNTRKAGQDRYRSAQRTEPLKRAFPGVRDLKAVTEAALGGQPRLATSQRLRGGSKKGVYRLTFEDQSTVIAYVWDAAENYWPSQDSGSDGPFAEASGAELFATDHTCLLAAGVPVPRLYAIDRSRRRYPADVAFVEDVSGGSLQDKLDREPAAAGHALARLGEALNAMAALRCPAIGKVALVRDGVRDKRVARASSRTGRDRT